LLTIKTSRIQIYKEKFYIVKMKSNNPLEQLSKLVKKMGGFTGVATNNFNKTFSKMDAFLDLSGTSLTDETKEKITKISSQLSDKDKSELVEKTYDPAINVEQLKQWWSGRCKDEELIDILVSYSMFFREVFSKNSIEQLFDNAFKLDDKSKQHESDNGIESLGSLISSIFKQVDHTKDNYEKIYDTKQDIKQENKQEDNEDKQENNEDKHEDDAVFLSNLGNSISNAMRHFQDKEGEDMESVKEKVLNSFSDTGVDKDYMAKCFDLGINMGEKIEDLRKECTDSGSEEKKSDKKSEKKGSDNKSEKGEEPNPLSQLENIFKNLGEKASEFKDMEEPKNLDDYKNYMGSFLKIFGMEDEDIDKVKTELDEKMALAQELTDEIKNCDSSDLGKTFKIILKKTGIDDKNTDSISDIFTSLSNNDLEGTFKILEKSGINDKPSVTSEEIRQGLVDEAVKMVQQYNKCASDCNTLISLLNPSELSSLKNIVGNVPIETKLNNLDTSLIQVSQKLDTILNRLDIIFDQQNGLSDMALDIELIRTKLSK